MAFIEANLNLNIALQISATYLAGGFSASRTALVLAESFFSAGIDSLIGSFEDQLERLAAIRAFRATLGLTLTA